MPWQKYDSRNDNGAMSQMLPGGGGGKHHVILGIRPDESAAEAQSGIPISEVTPGGPAEKAGLKAGDLIVAFNAKTMKNLSDISEALDSAHVGDKVVVKVMRDGKAVELNAVLGEP
jgi:S1-C subfamily serine protease